MAERSSERNTDLHPYSKEEQRVADFFFDAGVGGGNDPIGSIIASHQYLAADRHRLTRENEAMRKALNGLLAFCDVDSSGETDWERAVDVARAALASLKESAKS